MEQIEIRDLGGSIVGNPDTGELYISIAVAAKELASNDEIVTAVKKLHPNQPWRMVLPFEMNKGKKNPMPVGDFFSYVLTNEPPKEEVNNANLPTKT